MAELEINYATCRKFLLSSGKDIRTSDSATKLFKELAAKLLLKKVKLIVELTEQAKRKTISEQQVQEAFGDLESS